MPKDNLPKIEKLVVHVGIGRLSSQANFNDKVLGDVMHELARITGQKPQPRPAKKSISGFKSREGQTIGLKVTLHGIRASDFLKRVVSVALPRVKDFRGLSVSCVDTAGNLNIGIREHLSFAEISPEESKVNFGMQITVVLKGVRSREAAVEAYRALGVPLQK